MVYTTPPTYRQPEASMNRNPGAIDLNPDISKEAIVSNSRPISPLASHPSFPFLVMSKSLLCSCSRIAMKIKCYFGQYTSCSVKHNIKCCINYKCQSVQTEYIWKYGLLKYDILCQCDLFLLKNPSTSYVNLTCWQLYKEKKFMMALFKQRTAYINSVRDKTRCYVN